MRFENRVNPVSRVLKRQDRLPPPVISLSSNRLTGPPSLKISAPLLKTSGKVQAVQVAIGGWIHYRSPRAGTSDSSQTGCSTLTPA
jgi:hypothetical protein